jgi:hypothetical protein
MYKIIEKLQKMATIRTNKTTLNHGTVQEELTIQEKEAAKQLNAEELQFIITSLGDQSFKIKDIEFVYNLIVKLQTNYLERTERQTR